MAASGKTYDDLRTSLKRKEFSPVYFLYGEEDFLIDEAVQLIIEAALTPDERGFNLDVMYGSEADAGEVAAHAASFPMNADRRVVVVKEFDKLGNKEAIIPYLERPAPSTCLVLVAGDPDLRKRPYATAKRAGFGIEFKALYDNQVPGWVATRAKSQGRELDPEAARLLAGYVGTSLREIQNELDKLYIYAGDRKNIVVDDIAAVVGASKEFNVFELQKSVGTRDLPRAVEIVERMLQSGESAVLIITMLTRYFVTLWKLQDLRRRGVSQNELTSKLSIHPYFLKEYLAVLQLFTVREIEQAFRVLLSADEQLKSTPIDHREILQSLIVCLVAPPTNPDHPNRNF